MQGSLETWWCFLELLLARSTSDLVLCDQLVHGRRESLVGFVLMASLAYGHSVVFLGGQPHWCYGLLSLPDRSRAWTYPCGCGPWSQSLRRFWRRRRWDSGWFYGRHRYCGHRLCRSRSRQIDFLALRRNFESDFVLGLEHFENLIQVSDGVGPLVFIQDFVDLVAEFPRERHVFVLLHKRFRGRLVGFDCERAFGFD